MCLKFLSSSFLLLSLISPPVYSKLPPVLASGLLLPTPCGLKLLDLSEGAVLGELRHYQGHEFSLATFPPEKYIGEGDKMTSGDSGW